MTPARSSDRSRARILDAARTRFGEVGFDRTTIRDVAQAAQVDPALVIRYFGSKAALFAEAAELDLKLPDLVGAAPEQWADLLLPRFFAVWEDDASFLPLLRAAATNPGAAEALRGVFVRQVLPVIAAAVDDAAEDRAGLVGAQILGLALARYVLQIPPVSELTREEVTAWVGPVLTYYLTTPA